MAQEVVTIENLAEFKDKFEGNLKTINGNSIVGEGNIEIQGGGGEGVFMFDYNNGSPTTTFEEIKQAYNDGKTIIIYDDNSRLGSMSEGCRAFAYLVDIDVSGEKCSLGFTKEFYYNIYSVKYRYEYGSWRKYVEQAPLKGYVDDGLNGKQDVGDYALKSEIPSIEGLATTEEVTTAKNEAISSAVGAASQMMSSLSTSMERAMDGKDNLVKAELNAKIDGKQDTLVSGTNIKTINGVSVLGEGDLALDGDVETILWEGVAKPSDFPIILSDYLYNYDTIKFYYSGVFENRKTSECVVEICPDNTSIYMIEAPHYYEPNDIYFKNITTLQVDENNNKQLNHISSKFESFGMSTLSAGSQVHCALWKVVGITHTIADGSEYSYATNAQIDALF